MAGKKKVAVGCRPARSMPNASERARNRASPKAVVKLYGNLSDDQKASIAGMDLKSMLDIKCNLLHNPLINWLGPLYDKHTREFVNPGRGRIPLNADSVYRTLGLPRGQLAVRYAVDPEIEARLRPIVFPNHSSTPKITEVATIIEKMTDFEDRFKQIWIMYLVCTLLCPTTCNKVSNRVYYIMDNFAEVHNMNICQFVADKLREVLAADSLGGACLFHMQLLYVDSLDVSHLNINLPDGQFVCNRWSKKNIDSVLEADLKRDCLGYGNLERQEKVAKLIGDFASGLTGLLGRLVQGWTEVDEDDDIQMEHSFGDLARGIDIVVSSDGAGTSTRVPPIVEDLSGHGSPIFSVPPLNQYVPDVGNRKLRTAEGGYSETCAATIHNVGTSSPIAKGPSVHVNMSIDQTLSRVTRSGSKCATAGKVLKKISAMPTSHPVSNSSINTLTPVSAPRLTRLATKSSKACHLSDGGDIPHIQSAVSSSKDTCSDYVADPDYSVDDNEDDDIDRYFMQPRHRDIPFANNGDYVPASNTVVAPSLIGLVGESGVAGEDMLNLVGTGNIIEKEPETGSFHISCTSIPNPDNINEEAPNYNVEHGACLAGGDGAVNTNSRCFGPLEARKRSDIPQKSSFVLGPIGAVVDGKRNSEQVELGESVLPLEKISQSVKQAKKRRLRLVSKEDEPSRVAGVGKNCAAENFGVFPPPRKHMKVYSKNLNLFIFSMRKLNDAGNGKATRSSPRLAPKFVCSTGAANYGKESNENLQAPGFHHSVDLIGKGIANSDCPVSAQYSSEGMSSGGFINVGFGTVEPDVRIFSFQFPTKVSDQNIPAVPNIVNATSVGTSRVDAADATNVSEGVPVESAVLALATEPLSSALPTENDTMRQEGRCAVKIEESEPVDATSGTDGIGDDVEMLYVTPTFVPVVPIIPVGSITLKTKLRMARVVLPSQYMLPPYSRIVSSEEQDKFYQQIIKHHRDCDQSMVKNIRILQIEPTWVETWDLAGSMKPTGELSNTLPEIGIAVLQQDCPTKKIIFPWIVTVYLLERKFNSNVLKKHFHRDANYQLSHQSMLSFGVFQDLGTKQNPRGHWYSLFLNFDKKRFEVLDSARSDDDRSLINHATSLVDAIKAIYLINYYESSKQIQEYELVYINAPKQNNKKRREGICYEKIFQFSEDIEDKIDS